MMFDYDRLLTAVSQDGVGLRVRTELEPLAGAGEKIFPPSYGVGQGQFRYAVEKRRVAGASLDAVVLDSVASQANRFELALLEAHRRGELALPMVSVDFRDTEVASLDLLSALEAPHRIFDALLRDSLLDGVAFRLSGPGTAVTEATVGCAAALFHLSPTTLLFGGWDSTGPKGGRGAKYERAITSEIVAYGIETGSKTASRLDPAAIERGAAELFEAPDGEWTLDREAAVRDKDKPRLYGKASSDGPAGRPSQANHGNVTPSIDTLAGGVTADRITATTVLSFPALRRLRFPLDADGAPLPDRRTAESAARTALAALGVAATVLAFEDGFDLRSRCVLNATGPMRFELLRRGGISEDVVVDRAQALALVQEASSCAADVGLSWADEELLLQPAPRLVDLVARSRNLAAREPAGQE